MIIGLIIVFIGISVGNYDVTTDSIGEYIKFGADFYTEIYDVTKQVGWAVNNATKQISKIICKSVSALITSIGLMDIAFFGYKLILTYENSKKEKTTIFKAAETVTNEACTQPNQTAPETESTTAEINTPPAAEEPKSLVDGIPFMAEPKDFEMNKSWHNGVEKLSDEKLLKRYLSTYEYSDIYRYICYLEIVKRSKESK